MRLAFVSIMGGAAWAASEELWADAARNALTAGHQVLVSVYERSANAAQIAELHDAGARIHLRSFNRWMRKSAILTRLRGTFAELQSFDADAICINQGGTYDITRSGNMTVLRRYLESTRIPFVLLCHCEQTEPRGIKKRRSQSVFAQAAVVGVLAKNLRELSERHLDMQLPNARVFQNPLRRLNFEYLAWPATPELRMAFVGRLEPVKGIDILIDALSTPNWRQRDWRLTLCGVGPEESALRHRAQAAGIGDRITFAGFVKDIVEVWKNHHILTMSSRLEGIPIAITEAMLCGRPVLATDIGGIREALVDGKTGFLIEQPDLHSVVATLERCWEHRGRLESMGRTAYEVTRAARDPNPGKTLVEWLTHSRSSTDIPS
jgi:glycosyltransferase involved in cell wall biosynthesis